MAYIIKQWIISELYASFEVNLLLAVYYLTKCQAVFFFSWSNTTLQSPHNKTPQQIWTGMLRFKRKGPFERNKLIGFGAKSLKFCFGVALNHKGESLRWHFANFLVFKWHTTQPISP
jgi:hypothetical protein